MEVLALIPARGGSKGIPRKNLAQLGGKTLLRWAIDAARDSELVSRIVVSTDDDEIAAAAENVDVLRRPSELAADETPMLDVIRHALEHARCDVLVLLQPTSPFRTGRQVDEGVQLLLEKGADTCVSVVEVPHRYAPESLMELGEDGLLRARAEPTTRQTKPRLFARNGPAILALRPATLGDGLYTGRVVGYVMDERSSVDIDTPADLELAERLL